MNNKITIDIEEIRKLPNNSISDPETIRQIALLDNPELFDKIDDSFTYAGLYPEVMKSFNILPDKLK